MPDLLKETSPSVDNLKNDTANNFREINMRDPDQMRAHSEQFRSCTAAEANQYIKDRILPSCSIEEALLENTNNGNFKGASSAMEALSVKQEEWQKAHELPQDPQSVIERQYKENLKNAGSIDPQNRGGA